jgi:hypothetical protein
MRSGLPWLLLVGCSDPGRLAVSFDVELRVVDQVPTWSGGSATLTAASLHVGQLVLREAPDGAWGEDRFDDRPADPITQGVAGAAWAGSRDVDLLGSEGGVLAVVEGYEGDLVSADFVLGSNAEEVQQTLAMAGTVTTSDGAMVPFDVLLVEPLEVVALPIDVTVAAFQPTARLLWWMDLGEVLSQVDWAAYEGSIGVSQEDQGVTPGLRHGLGRPATWDLSWR